MKDRIYKNKELILVLDNCHLINNQQIDNIPDELLKYFSQKFHRVIITRRDPMLKISTLKSHGNVNGIKISDLSFTTIEPGK